jgi:hypothetical protein
MKSSVDWQMRRKRWTAVLQSRREAYFESWAASCGVEILFEMVRVTCTSVVGGSGGSGGSGGESRVARACADQLVISSEGWNEVIPSEWTAAAGLALASPAPSLACNRIIPHVAQLANRITSCSFTRLAEILTRPGHPSPRAFPRKPQS